MYKFRIGESVAVLEPGVFATGVISGISRSEEAPKYKITLDPGGGDASVVSVSGTCLLSLGLMPEEDRLRLFTSISQLKFLGQGNIPVDYSKTLDGDMPKKNKMLWLVELNRLKNAGEIDWSFEEDYNE